MPVDTNTKYHPYLLFWLEIVGISNQTTDYPGRRNNLKIYYLSYVLLV